MYTWNWHNIINQPDFRKNTNLQRYMHPSAHSSISYESCQNMEANGESISRWMDENVAYIHNGVLLNIRKNWNLPFAAKQMDLEGITLNETVKMVPEKLFQRCSSTTYMHRITTRLGLPQSMAALIVPMEKTNDLSLSISFSALLKTKCSNGPL